MWKVRRGWFDEGDLVPADMSRTVIHATGGPLMEVECIEGDRAVCSWTTCPPDWPNHDPEVKPVRHREMILLGCLCRAVPLTPEDVESLSVPRGGAGDSEKPEVP